VLVAVGAGDEVAGAGAGVVAGGARVWLAARLGLGDGAGARADCGDGLAGAWVACGPLGRATARVPGCVLAMPCGLVPGCPSARDGAAVAVGGTADGTVWTFAAGAGAVRANTMAKPTVASAPS
jgi:hypothetical protein